jgi:hypothetical protein
MTFGGGGWAKGVLATAVLVAVVAAGCGVESAQPRLPTDPPSAPPGSSSNDQPVGTMTRGPYLQHADDGVTIVWYTDEPTEGRVRWQVDEATGEAASSAGLATRHEAVISALRPGARYTYRVYSGLGPLAAAGGAAEFSFRAPQPDVVRLVVFGDSGEASPGQHAVARAIAAEPVPPDLVLIVGDVSQPPPSEPDPTAATEATYDARFFAPYRTLLPAIPFYAALGNHDYEVEKGQAYLDIFTLPRNGPPGRTPESAYWFERAGALMIVHDTNQSPTSLLEEAVPWHDEVARRPATFRFAFQHHPVYGSGPNAALYPSGPLREILAPLYTRSGVDVAFNGHDHLYERTKPMGGVVYVTTGAGGAALYPPATTNGFTAAFVNDRFSYTYLEVRDRTMTLRQTDADGQTIDVFQITKPVVASDRLRAFAGAGSPPRGWDEVGFEDSSWPAAEPTAFASALRARRRFDLPRGGEAAEAWLRVRGVKDYAVRLNGVAVARGDETAEAAFPVAPSLLRRGANALTLEGTVDGTEGAAPSLELSLVSSLPR